MTFGQRLRKAREGKNLTRKHLATIVSKSVSTIKSWELDVHEPAKELQAKIEQRLGLPLGTLSNDTDSSMIEVLNEFNQWVMSLSPEEKKIAAEVMKAFMSQRSI
ncbi:hypothetical protein DN730_08175 [Marinomonas piezotolerans]|uniref:HTH cro/C1-type domain-containing protein n=1 Tax=Marinomonas piezotolerans TaxID=2213058 RepID=A0A370U9D0_9GAMM|nr:helix-turn-helix transcriptional regulator [Marinomonas piezotolerans]RDL44371.1 hypothetical protein DN730_08175 [Marinomonas piezotolerans]